MTNQIRVTHEFLDHEEAKVLALVQSAARHATPGIYKITLNRATLRFRELDDMRTQLLSQHK